MPAARDARGPRAEDIRKARLERLARDNPNLTWVEVLHFDRTGNYPGLQPRSQRGNEGWYE